MGEAWTQFFIFIALAWVGALLIDTAFLVFIGKRTFNDGFVDAFIANVASGGATLILFSGGLFESLSDTLFYGMIPVVFILIEGIILATRRENISLGRMWGIAIAMNLTTYLILYICFQIF